MHTHRSKQHSTVRRPWVAPQTLLLLTAACAVCTGAMSAYQDNAPGGTSATLDETRLTMGKWIETQQLISKERNEWQQGKEVLLGRLDLVKKEIATLDEKIASAQSAVAEAGKKRDALLGETATLKTTGAQLTEAVGQMEREVRVLFAALPAPLQEKLQPLYQRIPEDAATTRVSAAERFQNVIGILNELNRANNEITVNYEVHDLADGRPSEVRAIYIGLAQAYFVSAAGDAGIGRPTQSGWVWAPAKTAANNIVMALEILQGKQSPAFVPLPVKIQ